MHPFQLTLVKRSDVLVLISCTHPQQSYYAGGMTKKLSKSLHTHIHGSLLVFISKFHFSTGREKAQTFHFSPFFLPVLMCHFEVNIIIQYRVHINKYASTLIHICILIVVCARKRTTQNGIQISRRGLKKIQNLLDGFLYGAVGCEGL